MIIDPATEWEYESGGNLKVGGALTFESILNPVRYQSEMGLIIEGLNHGNFLTINSTRCYIDGKNYSIRSISMT